MAEATRKNKAESKEIRREPHDLAVAVRLLAADQRHEAEKLALRPENELRRFERRLPPAKHGK